jgi:hypothetical protein
MTANHQQFGAAPLEYEMYTRWLGNKEQERGLVATALVDEDVRREMLVQLTPSDFNDEAARDAWIALAAGDTLDATSRSIGWRHLIGDPYDVIGRLRIASINRNYLTTNRRLYRWLSLRFQHANPNLDEFARNISETTESLISNIDPNPDLFAIEHQLSKVAEHGTLDPVLTGVPAFDEAAGGLQFGILHALRATDPRHTVTLCRELAYGAARAGVVVLFVSFHRTPDQHIADAINDRVGLDSDAPLAELTRARTAAVDEITEDVGGLLYLRAGHSGTSSDELRSMVARLKQFHPGKPIALVIDDASRVAPRRERSSGINQELLDLAHSPLCTVVAITAEEQFAGNVDLTLSLAAVNASGQYGITNQNGDAGNSTTTQRRNKTAKRPSIAQLESGVPGNVHLN